MIRRGGVLETPAATEAWARRADELQYDLKEGPCLDAVWHEDRVHSSSLANDPRWPAWGPRVAAETGARSALCLKLFTTEDTLGALNLYAKTDGAFGPDDIQDGLALSAHIAVAVAAAVEIQGLTAALDSRTLIGQATGIVMGRYEVDAQRAFEVLTRLSSHRNMKVRDLAAQIAQTGRIPTDTK